VIVVAFASTVIPHSMELVSLRRLPPSTFAVLTCLSPVFATVIGWLALGQQLSTIHYLAIALVTAASIGAVAQTPRRGTPPTGPAP
jgi:inner membrane transporter RhtA